MIDPVPSPGCGWHRRDLLTAGVGVGCLNMAGGPAWAARADVHVDPAGGERNVPTLAAALDRAAAAGGRPFTISLGQGTWVEKCTIRIPNLTIVGAGPDSVIAFAAAAGLSRPDGGKWGTGGSATLTVEAPGLTLRDLTIRNSFDYLQDRITHASGGAQAVALSITGRADRVRIERCRIEGYQDTLYVQGRSHFTDCFISGTVDFIFGGAAALFDRCEIRTRLMPGADSHGYLTAPSTPRTQPYGLVFRECRITRDAGVPDASTSLGRPWRAGNNMDLVGASTFLHCWMDAHIRREGWSAMGYRDPAGTSRMLTPGEARLTEYASKGPGAGPAGPDRRLLSAAEARAIAPRAVFGEGFA